MDFIHFLKANSSFRTLDETLLESIASELQLVQLSAKQSVFKQGDPSDAMYIVVSGRLKAAILKEDGKEMVVTEIVPGQPVGEMQVLTGGMRTASVYADCDSRLLKVSKATLDRLADKEPDLLRQIGNIILQRLRSQQLLTILPKLFGSINKNEINQIEEKFKWIKIRRGEILCRQGDPGDRFYILISGRLGVIEEKDGHRKLVQEIMRGESVGEWALLTDERRAATVYALRDSELVQLDKADFHQLLEKYPKLLLQITRLIINRLRGASARTRSEASTFAIVPASSTVPLSEFVHRLVVALAEFGPALHINSERLDRMLGTPGAAQFPDEDPRSMRIAPWLDEQETRHRFLVYETDRTFSRWTWRCLKQADHILIVGQASGNPQPGEIEIELRRLQSELAPARQTLVLLHPDGSRQPSGTSKWLEARRVQNHHHMRWDTNADFERVARFLAGRAIGLALGGGGARGFAHIGAIRAFCEAGVPIDIVGGTSMGSYIAGEYALGWNARMMLDTNRKCFSTTVFDPTLPIVSMFSGRRYVKRLARFFSHVRIEDLWLPYFCVSSNISRGEVMVHRSGELWRGMRASSGVQGLMPPVVHNGDLLVDGALLSNLPADVMKEQCAGGIVIAVDVSPPVDLAENVSYGDYLSGWRVLWSRINPFTPAITLPSIATIMQRSGELASQVLQKNVIQKTTDFYIHMPVEHFSWLDFGAIEKIVEVGYRHAQQEIAKWLENTPRDKH